MKYKNISEQPLTIPTAEGDRTVDPGDEVLTAPMHAQPFCDRGQLEVVSTKPARSARRSASTEESDS